MSMLLVEPTNERRRGADLPGRWLGYWHQIDEVVALGARSCLEIGGGTGLVGEQLRRSGVAVTTVGRDECLGVDRVGDVRSLPCAAGEFDVVLCSRVLEHLPWSDVPGALRELHRVCRQAAVVSLPQSGLSVRLAATVEGYGLYSAATRAGRVPAEHVWQVGGRGIQRRRVRQAMAAAGFAVERSYTVPEFTFHRFYVLHKR